MSINIFLNKLADKFCGDIENTIAQNFVQATDNSIYQLIPQSVIYPKNAADIILALNLAQEEEFKDIKFTARGGATGTNGQSLNKGVIIDCSRHFNKIIALNIEESWIEVDPGVVLKELNDFLAPHNYHFAPHISPDDRATIGGMIATDACGKGSSISGKTSDNLIAVSAVLADGSEYDFKDFPLSELDYKGQKINLLITEKEALIKKKFPNRTRFSSGYNLSKLSKDQELRLPYLLAGSEGTLGIITKARLKIVKINHYKALVITHYDDFINSLKDAKNLLKFKPYAIEAMDEKILELAKQQKSLPAFIRNLIDDVKNINIVEFQSDSDKNLKKQVQEFLDSPLYKNAQAFYDKDQIRQIWDLRKSGVGIAGNLAGKKKPIPFIEDSCVPPHNLADYITQVKELLDQYDLYHVIYGHLDVGCLHVRPALDLSLEEDKKLIRELTSKIIELVKKYDGIVWGEHSAGFRVEYSSAIFGEEIYQIFCKIKSIFDPHNRLNPRKIAGEELVKIDENLQADFNKDIDDDLKKKFEKAISCNGNAKCLSSTAQQTMCPSYKVTKEKIHSPKGRANLIRNWLVFRSKNPVPKNFIKKAKYKLDNKDYLDQIYDSLHGCLSCKACSNSCPLSVDIPTYKSLFFDWYHKLYFRDLRDIVFSKSEELLAFMARFPLASKIVKQLARLLYITGSPEVHNGYYQQDIQEYILNDDERLPKNTVLIVTDSFTNFGEKDLLKSSISVLEKIGFNVKLIPFFSSGKAALNSGKIAEFKKIAVKNITILQSQKDFPIIAIEPSIYCLFKEDYKSICDADLKVILISEFLHKNQDKLKTLAIKKSRKVDIFLHCTEKTSIPESSRYWNEIFATLNFQPQIIDTGCCGMAGDYGYQAEHFDNSRKLFDLTWKKPLEESGLSVATGFSCRSQIKRFGSLDVRHPLDVINGI